MVHDDILIDIYKVHGAEFSDGGMVIKGIWMVMIGDMNVIWMVMWMVIWMVINDDINGAFHRYIISDIDGGLIRDIHGDEWWYQWWLDVINGDSWWY